MYCDTKSIPIPIIAVISEKSVIVLKSVAAPALISDRNTTTCFFSESFSLLMNVPQKTKHPNASINEEAYSASQ
jgi:hypothetical protein